MNHDPTQTNFLNWRLSVSQRFAAHCEVSSASQPEVLRPLDEGRSMRAWASLEDGPRLHARLHGVQLSLEPERRSALRVARRWIRSAPRPQLSRLEISANSDGTLRADVELINTTLPHVIDGEVSIVIPERLLKNIGVSDPNAWLRRGLIHPPGARDAMIMVMKTAIELLPEERQSRKDSIEVLLPRGDVLRCRREAVPRGSGDFLLATALERESYIDLEASTVRFIQTPSLKVFTGEQAPTGVRGTALEQLDPIRHPHLMAWIDYEGAEVAMSREQRADAQQVKPEYSEVLDITEARTLLLLPSDDALKNTWVNEHQWQTLSRSREGVALDHRVEVLDLERGEPSEPRRATHLYQREMDQRLILSVETNSQSLPPVGRLTLVADEGDEIRHSRRREALERLLSGRAVQPELLRHLLFPRTIPSIRSQDRTHSTRHGGPRLNNEQRAAVVRAAREPAMLLIQGPPGTGKTTVIAEIIHALRHRHRNDDGALSSSGEPDDVRTPFRVLVSSVQNDAVDNAVEKLALGRVLVDQLTKDHKGDSAREKVKSVIEAMEQRVKASHRHQTREEIRALLDQLRALAPLVNFPDKHTQESLGAIREGRLSHDQRGQLELLRRDLERALSDAEGPSESTADQSPAAALKKDVEGIVDRLAMLREVDDGNHDEVAVLVSGLLALTALHANFDVLEGDARNLHEALDGGSFRRINRLLKRVMEEARCVLQDETGEEGKRVEVSALIRWEEVARRWVERAIAATTAEFEDLGHGEEAILSDFLHEVGQRSKPWREILSSHAPVTGTTCQKADRFRQHVYDVAIIDEAARGGIDTLIPMTMARSIILIGDQNQLPPHVEAELEARLDEQLRREVDLRSTSLFTYLWLELRGVLDPCNRCISLTRQYRMHRDIGQVVSRVFYEPEVMLEHDCEGGVAAKRSPTLGLLSDEPFAWVDTSDRPQQSPYRGDCRESSIYEVDLISKLLSAIDPEQLMRMGTQPALGVITFYKKQKELIQMRINQQHSALRSFISVGTVDSFQGRDFPHVFISSVRSNRSGQVGFLSLPNRLNVALSRARRQVVLFADSQTLACQHQGGGSEPFR